MHGELFKSRCDRCHQTPFTDRNVYESPADLPHCECGGVIRPHICWFGEIPFEMERIGAGLARCTLFIAIGTSGVVEPAASFAGHVYGRGRTVYVGPEEPGNRGLFSETFSGKAGELLPKLLEVDGAPLDCGQVA